MARIFNVIVEQDEDGWLISDVVGLPGCHTQAKSLDELMERTKEAIALCIKCQKTTSSKERFVALQQIVV